VRPVLELLADVDVAHRAVNRLEIILVRELGPIEIHVTVDTAEIGVDGSAKSFGIDKDRDLVVAALPYEFRVLVAHETILVLLCRCLSDEHRHDEDGKRKCLRSRSTTCCRLSTG
jgi:hypothetical protein